MRNTTGNKIRLGIFIFISSSLFITGIYFIGQRQQLFNKTFLVSGIFKDISGLQVGNNVRFSGINVGIIEEVEQITDSTVRVDMLIEEHSRKFIKKNAKATIGSDGLMGNKIVILVPGTFYHRELSNNDTLETVQPVSMDDILYKIKLTSNNTASITSDLAIIFRNIRQGKGTMGKLFSDTVLAENVNEAMINIKQGAGGFKQNMDAAGKSIFLRGFFKRKADRKKQHEEKEKNKK